MEKSEDSNANLQTTSNFLSDGDETQNGKYSLKDYTNTIERSASEVGDKTHHENGEEEDDLEYPKSWKLGLITVALCLSVFCVALDNTIIATAIPKVSPVS